ncbi:precorrin-2 dehydrogenase/sirohydrochlorin ferrochelatase family protein [Natronomonas sp. EA1]|uniref:precorrin-2 dehydrogenase/sirohydrochlorin ferrochelatase family protein n=1 Tax=Natronomonas sp. EA1 TaxID=3421655 RepID=UPI003EBC9DBF
MIPLVHDFTGTTVLVFGGGAVGARKARRFAQEARVVVVSPAFDGEFPGCEQVRAAPAPDEVGEWLDRFEPALVVAATDVEALNAAIETAARERGVLVNRTDIHGEREPGSVVVPATVRDGDVVVSISTGSPALTKVLRERLEEDIEGVGELAAVTADIRDQLQREEIEPARRRAAIRAVVESDRVWKLLGSGRANTRRVADAVVLETLGEHT